MSSPTRRRVAVALCVAILASTLAACTSTVALSPAPSANTVACADVTVRLPSTLESLASHDTNAQATGAWGSPAAIVLTCGITTPQVSDLPCNTVEGVDWLADQRGKDRIYTTYGRTPGVQVVVDSDVVASPPNVLFDLASAVGTLPQSLKCQSVSDAPGAATPSATPAP